MAAIVAGLMGTNARSADERPSAKFRQEHVEIREHLDHISKLAGKLGSEGPAQRREAMKKIVSFLKEHIVPHAQWEERVLYPAVDRRAGNSAQNPFTATMRNDHAIVGRWISELEKESGQADASGASFARKTDRLLGLIVAHFENEEEVLLPVLDRTMTRAQFEQEIMSKGGH
jgi:hemerythrin-like domain-containing protein